MKHNKHVSIVLSCIDYRFWPDAMPLLEKRYGEFDLIELAGASKNLASPSQEADRKAVLENIGVSVKLHGAKRIILTNHVDCGAYGGSTKFNNFNEELKFHKNELSKAELVIKDKFPDLLVEKVFINHDKNGKINLI